MKIIKTQNYNKVVKALFEGVVYNRDNEDAYVDSVVEEKKRRYIVDPVGKRNILKPKIKYKNRPMGYQRYQKEIVPERALQKTIGKNPVEEEPVLPKINNPTFKSPGTWAS